MNDVSKFIETPYQIAQTAELLTLHLPQQIGFLATINHRTRYIAMILAVSLMLAALFAQLVDIPSPSHNFDLLLNSLHAPGSGMIAVIVMALFRNPSKPVKSYIIAAATITLGTLGELAQVRVHKVQNHQTPKYGQ